MSNNKITKILCAAFLLWSVQGFAQTSKTFEMRYFTNDDDANGETDFKGQTEYLDVEKRVEFLGKYANYAKNFFNDPELNTIVAKDSEVQQRLNSIKPQPLPEVRKRHALNQWKWVGHKDGKAEASRVKIDAYNMTGNLEVISGHLNFTSDTSAYTWELDPQSWRFSFTWRARPATVDQQEFIFSDGHNRSATIGFDEQGNIFYVTAMNERKTAGNYQPGKWYTFKIEFDLAAFKRKQDLARYNLYVNGNQVADYVPVQRVRTEGVGYAQNFVSISYIDQFKVIGHKGLQIDDVWGVGYHLTGRESYPYTISTFLDESFDPDPFMNGWHAFEYNDSLWHEDELPIVHGSERYANEDLYLRKKIKVGEFEQAFLNVETLNPGGAIWINGEHVAVIPNRHPKKIDVTRYLRKNKENIIAVKVNYFYLDAEEGEVMPHSSLDFNVGWFAGRMHLDLVKSTFIEDVMVHTTAIEGPSATVRARIPIKHTGYVSFRGKATIKLYPWVPEESSQPAAAIEFPVVIGHGKVDFVKSIDVANPKLWSDKTPNLYKVHVELTDEHGNVLDDFVTTTGIRTISQKNGTFHLNGEPYMLNGAQIMGFRGPIENMMKWVLCPPAEWIVREMLMIKNMNGNLLRVHVHGWEFPAVNINDPRYGEIADQLGMMMIWGTPAWVRTGRGWGQIDWEGYPVYMKEVFNHPSIVIWETANHTQSFKERDVLESNLFCEKGYETIYPLDSSRLISLNSYVRHLHYGNDAGTIDQQGNPIEPTYAWTAPMVTRGNQDGITGYSRNWTELRTWPDDYIASFLNSDERAYFNFEHEESMAQPNWNLVKGKPWYRLHSYEWEYDEGTIGRRLTLDEWLESQGWQAFSAWESMKKQRFLDYDGFSWCCLHGGANTVTYKKPLIDFMGHAKLAWYVNKMVFQPTIGGSADVDVVWGPDDRLKPVIMHWGHDRKADLSIEVKNEAGELIFTKKIEDVQLKQGRNAEFMYAIDIGINKEGYYFIDYTIE